MSIRPYILALYALVLTSCGGFTKLSKCPDSDYKYEAAKQYFVKGKYNDAALLLNDVIPGLKGTEKGDESTFVLSMCKFLAKDYVTSNDYFKRYCTNYPTSVHVDEARFYAARSLYLSTPQPELDQTDTYQALTELQNFLEICPDSKYVPVVRDMIFELQDKLVEKEYMAAQLYYNLGNYFGNCTMGGNNFEACIITAENAIKDYPYTSKKEDFSILILRAKYELAASSIASKMKERYENTLDEYYGFVNEYPESKYTKEAKGIYEKAKAMNEKLQ